ncbi:MULTISPECIES: serine hydrolase domain-containing protein [Arthrobacter]|uniref:Serine hydrolase domain-containing protein n=2 Tax=Arthrobacter TaxID=1663 RepID=A0ABU9KIU5_9MICC|nr:serine hydrolase domain-containing protein [Arthrobacter sp. YJM1]MDP5226942.1 serine hydrolase domain-containing protein [Arthrobacter sp. YJM1]
MTTTPSASVSGVTVHGTATRGFERTRQAFAQGFDGAPDMGAAVSVYRDGEKVVDLWGGTRDARSALPWEEETAAVMFSCTKGLASVLIARLVEQGLVDYDAPLASYWPEFAANGKGRLTVREALGHRAGLSAVRQELTREQLLDWDFMTALLAAQEPLWEPGTGFAYHSITHGWLSGELIRRVTGRTAGALFQEVFSPVTAEAWLGLPAAEETRVAHIGLSEAYRQGVAAMQQLPNPFAAKGPQMGGALPPELVTETEGANDRSFHAAEFPAAGGISTARALAALWSATVRDTGGTLLLGTGALENALRPVSEGRPELGFPEPWADRFAAGFQLPGLDQDLLSPAGFGHYGAGGQLGFADPVHGIGFGYLTNWMVPDAGRATAVVQALREDLAAL